MKKKNEKNFIWFFFFFIEIQFKIESEVKDDEFVIRAYKICGSGPTP